MKKSSSKVLKRAAAMLSAGVLAAAMAAPAAWAADIPGVGDDLSTYTGSESGAQVDSNVHLLVLNADGGGVISVTAPTDIYLAAKTDGNEVVDFVAPSKTSAVIANLGSQKTKVASWAVDAGSAGLAKVKGSEETDKGFWKSDAADMTAGTIASKASGISNAVADSFWLQANEEDIAVPGSPTKHPDKWVMKPNSESHAGDHIDLELVGQIYNPTKAWYTSAPVIDKVTWTFAIAS